MHNVLVILTVKDSSDADEIQGLLAEQGRLSREEPGCVRFEVYRSQNDTSTFILMEQWESRDAHEIHRTAAAYNEIYVPKVLPRVDRVPHVSDLVG